MVRKKWNGIILVLYYPLFLYCLSSWKIDAILNKLNGSVWNESKWWNSCVYSAFSVVEIKCQEFLVNFGARWIAWQDTWEKYTGTDLNLSPNGTSFTDSKVMEAMFTAIAYYSCECIILILSHMIGLHIAESSPAVFVKKFCCLFLGWFFFQIFKIFLEYAQLFPFAILSLFGLSFVFQVYTKGPDKLWCPDPDHQVTFCLGWWTVQPLIADICVHVRPTLHWCLVYFKNVQ